MPQPVSEAYVRALYASTTPDIALLVTIRADGLAEPLRATTWPAPLPGSTRLGLVSRGSTYAYFPFSFTWGGSGVGEISRSAKLEIANVDGEVSRAVRTAVGKPTVDVESVRISDPDVVEMGMVDAGLDQVEIDRTHASATISGRDFANEPAVGPRYTSSRTPAVH
jgi:hypothetical protein